MQEAEMHQTAWGLRPAGQGWFVVNARDTAWEVSDKWGAAAVFEGDERFSHFGINLTVIRPGQPSTMYHGESNQEDFLVLAGQCRLLIEEQERLLGPWDFVHCPPGTLHGFVGAGNGLCVILAVGYRDSGERIVYPVSPLAQCYGAGVEVETGSAREAYRDCPEPYAARPDGWAELPWHG